jgi:hypothetical protein
MTMLRAPLQQRTRILTAVTDWRWSQAHEQDAAHAWFRNAVKAVGETL